MTHYPKQLFAKPNERNIFVFGSNLAGRHGAGAAKFAVDKCGAIYGVGFGLQGSSFAIPTKDENLNVMPLHLIAKYVEAFVEYAKTHPELTFYVTAIGTGLSGYSHLQIAPMFGNAPDNCVLPDEWQIL